MKTTTVFLVILFFISVNVKPQTDTLVTELAFEIPYKVATSDLNLAYDNINFWVSEHLDGLLYKITPQGVCLDSIKTVRLTSVEYMEDGLWIIPDQSDWLKKIDKTNGQEMDSILIQIPEVFEAGYQCQDLCCVDSAMYSVWAYCWCGVFRILRTDFKTDETTDLGDIPLYENLVTINDTVWAGNNEIYPLLADDIMITSGRSLYLGDFHVSGIAYDNRNLWVIDYDSKQLKKLGDIPLSSPEQIKTKNDFFIYPNPASDHINIKTKINNPYTVELFSITGSKVITENSGAFMKNISLANIPQGIYLLKITHSGTSTISRIIKE